MEDKSFYGFREKGEKSRYQSFALELTSGCQLRCKNCYLSSNGGRESKDFMPTDFVRKMISDAKELGFAEIVFIGGEPTLHPDLPELMQFVIASGLTPILATNGIKLAEKSFCERVILPGTTVVIHGLVPLLPEEMDEHVSSSGYLEVLKSAYRNIDMLRGAGITVVAEATVIKSFLPHLFLFHKWCREKGFIPFIEFNRRENSGRLNECSVAPEEVERLFQKIQRWDKENARELMDKALTPPAYGNKCTMSITGLHVKSNFGAYSCCAQTVSHGDVRKKSLSEILAAPSMRIFKDQDDWIAGPCKDCKLYPVCKGGCRGEANLAFGCPRASCPACWRIPAEVRNDPSVMMPASCKGCILEGDDFCSPKR